MYFLVMIYEEYFACFGIHGWGQGFIVVELKIFKAQETCLRIFVILFFFERKEEKNKS